MLTATFELEQKDVNPDDYLEPKQHPKTTETHSPQSSSPVKLAQVPIPEHHHCKHHQEQQQPQQQNLADNRKSLLPLPLSAANSGWGSIHQPQQQLPLIKLKRRYRDKENSGGILEETTSLRQQQQQEPEEEPIRKRSLLEIVEEDIRRRLEQSSCKQKGRKRKNCLSLVAVQPEKKRSKERVEDSNSVEESIQCSPPFFEVEEEEPEAKLEKEDSLISLSGRSKRSSQLIDWDQVEVFSEEEVPAEEPKAKEADPFDFDSLFADKSDGCPPRTYASCSSSRLSLSKHFHQQQQQLLNGHQSCGVTAAVIEQASVIDKQNQQQYQPEAKCAKLLVGGEDDMSIHHQQHYHLPCTSVSSTTTSYHSEVASTSSILLLAAAAGESGKMAGHSHYTRSKASSLQGRFTLAAATDIAIAESLKELPRSKVSSLQGRLDTATELAIAQSLSEEQQNMLNSGTPTASPVVINLGAPTTTASIAAAANMNNSLATLCNIGNSCYLNSVLYTLRFAPNFIHNLHHLIEDTDSVYQRLSQNKLKSSSLGRNISGLHGHSGRSWSSKDLASLGGSTTTNNSSASTLSGSTGAANGTSGPTLTREEHVPPKTNRQVVTEQLHELFENLHRNEAIEALEPFHAGNILRAVQDVSATFEGNQQQDAHEFLMCVLDSVRESCQALIKTITDHPDVLINACPPVPESIESFVPESKSSGTRHFFRRRKESVKTPKPTTINGGATLPKVSSHGGGDGNTSDQLANLKNALFAKPSSALDEQLVRDRVQALELDFFRDDFEGVTVSKTKCLACETCTEQKETMIDIAIPIAGSEISDAAKNPQLFYQNSCITREYFRGDNKYRCEVCCGYREAIRSISFEVLPRQLILQLKRFNGDMEKINSYIPTPFVLRCFCNTCLPKPDCDKPHIYRLYSVITHVGARMSVGHYIAYTSSLDVHAEYLGCGKDRRKQMLLAGGSIDGGGGGSLGGGGSGNSGSAGKSGSEKSSSGHLKKLFSSKKASSAGDMSKKIKNNVVNKLNLINGMEGLNLINGSSGGSALGGSNTASFGSQSGSNSPSSNGTPTSSVGSLASRMPCAGLSCCGIHPKNSHLSLYGNNLSSNNSPAASATSGVGESGSSTNGVLLDGTDSHPNSVNSSSSPASAAAVAAAVNGLTATGTTPAAFEQSLSQQLWHMCDDDKIKIMSQAEFEELLSPNRRHVITPYLLFYARYDLVQGSARQKDSGVASEGSATTKAGDGTAEFVGID